MRQQTRASKEPAEKVVQDIRRATRKHYSAEEKIRIVWKVSVAMTVSPSSAAARGSSRTFITAGGKTFSRRGKSDWLAIRPGRDVGRGQGPASRDQRAEGSRGRTDPRKSSAQKKRDGGWGGRHMRYPASEKLEIIRLVEEFALPVRRTLEKVGIPRHLLPLVRSVPGRWPEALDDRHPRPDAAPQPAPLPQTSPQSVARSIKKLAPELLTITEPAPIRLQTGHS